MRLFAWLAGALVACAPQASSEPRAAHDTPARAETSTDSSESDSDELASALRREALVACARVCARLTSCTSPEQTNDCHDDCVNVLAGDQAAPAVRYAACVDGLSCDQIEESMRMGMGPVGRCYVDAQRMAR